MSDSGQRFFRSCRRCSYVKRVRSKEIWAYSLKKALAICNIKMCGWPWSYSRKFTNRPKISVNRCRVS
jgi:hypothetical protein